MAGLELLILASIIGAITLMAVGGNDVANSQATAVGSGALSLKGAYIVAGLCEFLGSSLMGGNVSSTLGNEFIDRKHAHISDNEYCWGMFCSLVSAAVWIFICTKLKMPVSTTHSIIGALVGFELVASEWKPQYLNWFIIQEVVLAWVASPLLGLILAYILMILLGKFWLDVNMKLRTLTMPLLDGDTDAVANPGGAAGTAGAGGAVSTTDATGTAVTADTAAVGAGAGASAEEKAETSVEVYGTGADAELSENKPDKPDTAVPDQKAQDVKDAKDAKDAKDGQGAQNLKQPQAMQLITPNYGATDNRNDVVDDVLVTDKPKAQKFGLLFGFVFTIIALFIFVGGPPDVRITELVPWWAIICIAVGMLLFGTVLGYFLEKPYHRFYYRRNHSFMTEDYFILFLIIASGAVSFAHGGNDVANVIGPFGSIYTYYKYGDLSDDRAFEVPVWLSCIGGLCIVIGFMLFGKSVMETIGNKITKLTYRTGFAAQFSAAVTVLICNVFGIPVSSTTVIVGAVAGVGIYSKESDTERKDTLIRKQSRGRMPKQSIVESTAKGFTYFWEKLKKMNYKVLGKILLTWIVTIPSNAILCGLIFGLYKIV